MLMIWTMRIIAIIARETEFWTRDAMGTKSGLGFVGASSWSLGCEYLASLQLPISNPFTIECRQHYDFALQGTEI